METSARQIVIVLEIFRKWGQQDHSANGSTYMRYIQIENTGT